MTPLFETARRAVVLLLLLWGAPGTLWAQPEAPAREEPGQEQRMQAMPEMQEMAPQARQQMGSMPMGSMQMGSMQPMMCTCPSALRGAGGIVLLALSALVAGSAAAALIALALFLLRRSRRAAVS